MSEVVLGAFSVGRDRDSDRRAARAPQPVKMRLHVVRINHSGSESEVDAPFCRNLDPP